MTGDPRWLCFRELNAESDEGKADEGIGSVAEWFPEERDLCGIIFSTNKALATMLSGANWTLVASRRNEVSRAK